jgi:hypothetical protein
MSNFISEGQMSRLNVRVAHLSNFRDIIKQN